MPDDRYYSSPTQIAWACEALLSGRTISHKTEIREVRGWRLGAIVHTLRSRYGWPIVAEYRGRENVAHYSLAPGIDPAALRFPRSATMLAGASA